MNVKKYFSAHYKICHWEWSLIIILLMLFFQSRVKTPRETNFSKTLRKYIFIININTCYFPGQIHGKSQQIMTHLSNYSNFKQSQDYTVKMFKYRLFNFYLYKVYSILFYLTESSLKFSKAWFNRFKYNRNIHTYKVKVVKV